MLKCTFWESGSLKDLVPLFSYMHPSPQGFPIFFHDLFMPNKRSLSISPLNEADVSEAIKLAWEDRTAFETIQERLGLSETELISLMRKELTPSSFKMWRMRMRGRKTKHRFLRVPEMKFDDVLIANHRRANC